MAGSVNQATGLLDFEDGSRTGTKLEVRNSLQSIRTISEVNLVGAGHEPGGDVKAKIDVVQSRQSNVPLAKFRAISSI